MDASEALDYEVEALVCTYLSQVAVLSHDFPRLLAVTIKPNTGEDESKEYVRATLELVVKASYPAEPPSILLSDIKGLEDARTALVLAALRAEAAELAGEPVLGQLVASATDWLTRFNAPGEACAFCLERQVPGEDGAGAGPPQLLRLPCYHCFHFACFARWWRWQQRETAAQRARLLHDLGGAAPAAAALAAANCVPDAAGRFPVLCPACRLCVPADALAGSLRWLEAPEDTSTGLRDAEDAANASGGAPDRPALAGNGCRGGTHEAAAASKMHSRASEGVDEDRAAQEDCCVRLEAADMARLRLAQRRNAELFARQQQAPAGTATSAICSISLGWR